MTTRRWAAGFSGLLMTTSLAAAPLAFAEPAAAAPVPCVKPAKDRHGHGEKVPLLRRVADHAPITAADLAAISEVSTRANSRLRGRTAAPRLAATVTIPVRIHVVRGKHRGERGFASKARIRRMMEILNNAHIGKQSSTSARTRFRFRLAHVDRTKRDGWHHAYLNGPRTKRMMRKLHRGGSRTLNLYITGPGSNAQPVLGFSRFPWQRAATPDLDGVVVHHKALPWGAFKPYNRGDTVVHEVGHWLGLFHTFQGGCVRGGDLVADTPAENVPSYACEVGRDSCPTRPRKDPIRNFMNYSFDSCMRQFTAGQTRRMDVAWSKWRQ